MTDESLRKFIDLAVRTGRIVVASDVYTALREYERTHPGAFDGFRIEESKFLEPGASLAFENPTLVFDGLFSELGNK